MSMLEGVPGNEQNPSNETEREKALSVFEEAQGELTNDEAPSLIALSAKSTQEVKNYILTQGSTLSPEGAAFLDAALKLKAANEEGGAMLN